MDQGTLEGIGTLLAMLAFIAVCVWAYSARNKARFDEAAMLPFVDEEKPDAQNGIVGDKTIDGKTSSQVTKKTLGKHR